MSVRLWGYEPEKCDGDYCPNNCDRCRKGDMTALEYTEDLNMTMTGNATARYAVACKYPKCEECDKYHGHYCTVPMVVSKQIYRLTAERMAKLEKSLATLETLVTDEILGSKE